MFVGYVLRAVCSTVPRGGLCCGRETRHGVPEDVEDTHKGNRIKACTKSCYSCGEEGHIFQNCLNGDLVEFPTEEVKYDP